MPFKKKYYITLISTIIFTLLFVGTKSVYAQYCSSCSSDPSNMWISRVRFNTINNPSGSTTCSDFTDKLTTINNGNSYPITINVSLTGSWRECVRVWVDWNHDNTFDTITEQYNIGCPTLTSPWETMSGTINVPVSATPGNTRMRVSLKYNIYPSPCESINYGEVEDYTVNVTIGTPTTTTTTITTTSTSLTTTTIEGTTTTTTDGTTTTSTSISTTTTLISLNCENNEIYVKQKNKCTVNGCKKGYWLITNYQNEPLIVDKVEKIPPNEIEFGPTSEIGKVFTAAVCLDPYITKDTIINIVKGPILICPDSCLVNEDCECEVDECKNGLFLLDNYENEPLESDLINDLSSVSFSYIFQPQEEGIVRARMICYDPYETTQEIMVNITHTVTTTTLPEELVMTSLTSNKAGCGLNVNKNTMNEVTKVFVQLIKEPQGTIYYSGTLNVIPVSTGSKSITLSKLESCPSGTKLKVLMLAYSESNLNDILYRIKDEAFTC